MSNRPAPPLTQKEKEIKKLREINKKLLDILKEYVNADPDPVDLRCRKTEALAIIKDAERFI